ncbi:unnamed protein product [Paramecium sonneborni]|uniref:Uncharacterized protein n=1 Tax=Paramecium sonneborni TaxID=65129 RepID=A0A8S1P9M2_9CILI|nr:unnamed protein product [Paramecium sonneborni]
MEQKQEQLMEVFQMFQFQLKQMKFFQVQNPLGLIL